jgi:hypothetical protein
VEVLLFAKSANNPPEQFSFDTTEDVGHLFEAVLATLLEPMLVLGSDVTVQVANPGFAAP